MSNTITHEQGNFSTIPNDLLNDALISLAAKGMYVFMRGKPPLWNFTIRSMAKQLKEGETAIGSALNELKDSGWISYTKHSNGKGVYHLFWSANSNTENPNQENPNQGNPMKGKPQRINKKEPIIKQIDNNTPIVPASGDDEDDKSKSGSKAKALAVMELYNETCGSVLSKAMAMSATRQRHIETVGKLKLGNGQSPFANYDLEAWKAYFLIVLENPWNTGQNERGWKADFDYVIKQVNVIKALERKYA